MARGIAVAAIAGLALHSRSSRSPRRPSPSAVTGRHDLGRRVLGRRRREGRSRRGGDQLVRRVRDDDRLRLPDRRAERGERHRPGRRDGTAARPYDGRDVPLPGRRDQRHRNRARRRPDVHHAGRARRRHQPGERARPDVRHRCGDGRPERQLDRLVGGVRHEQELRVANRHAVRRSRARIPSASLCGSRGSVPGSPTTSVLSHRMPSARRGEATGRSAPTPPRPSRPAASMPSPSPRRA